MTLAKLIKNSKSIPTRLSIKPLVLSTATLGLMFGVAHNAQAALISGVTASTDMGTFGGDLNFTVNGAGLPGNTPSLTGNHVPSTTGDSWLSADGNVTGTITFNLNGSYNLEGFSFWNFIGQSQSQFGINSVTVQASTDGTTFTTITGAPTQFAQTNALTPQPPEQFSFSPVQASFVRFVVNSNHGDPGISGFSEVQFDATPVPEPLTMLGAGTAAGFGAFFKRKLNQKSKQDSDKA